MTSRRFLLAVAVCALGSFGATEPDRATRRWWSHVRVLAADDMQGRAAGGDINLDTLRPIFPLRALTTLGLDRSSLGEAARQVVAPGHRDQDRRGTRPAVGAALPAAAARFNAFFARLLETVADAPMPPALAPTAAK